jgi:predicted metal-dependent RNase
MNAYSAHADRDDLLEYAANIKDLQRIILVHGEEDSALDLKKSLETQGAPAVFVPSFGETMEL